MRATVGRNSVKKQKKITLALAIKNPCLGRYARKTLRSEWLIFQKTELDMNRWEDRLRIALLVFISAKNNLSVKQLRGGFLWGGVPAHTTPPHIKQPHLANGNTTEVRIIFFSWTIDQIFAICLEMLPMELMITQYLPTLLKANLQGRPQHHQICSRRLTQRFRLFIQMYRISCHGETAFYKP